MSTGWAVRSRRSAARRPASSGAGARRCSAARTCRRRCASAIDEIGARAVASGPRLPCAAARRRAGISNSVRSRCAVCRCPALAGSISWRQCRHRAGRARSRAGVELDARRRQRGAAQREARGAFPDGSRSCRARSNGFSTWRTTCRRRWARRESARAAARAARSPCAASSATRTSRASPRRSSPTDRRLDSRGARGAARRVARRARARACRRGATIRRARGRRRRAVVARRATRAQPGDRILVFGSFLTVGPALEFLGI